MPRSSTTSADRHDVARTRFQPDDRPDDQCAARSIVVREVELAEVRHALARRGIDHHGAASRSRATAGYSADRRDRWSSHPGSEPSDRRPAKSRRSGGMGSDRWARATSLPRTRHVARCWSSSRRRSRRSTGTAAHTRSEPADRNRHRATGPHRDPIRAGCLRLQPDRPSYSPPTRPSRPPRAHPRRFARQAKIFFPFNRDYHQPALRN